MSDVIIKLKDAFEIRFLIVGGSNGHQVFEGFINQDITQGIKRKANKIAKKIAEELEDFNNTVKELVKEYGFEGLSQEEMHSKAIDKDEKYLEYDAKIAELLEESVLIDGVEKIPFSAVEDKVFSAKLDFELFYEYFSE